jgi:hypothetical protein
LHVPLCRQAKTIFCLLWQHEKPKLASLRQLAFHAAFYCWQKIVSSRLTANASLSKILPLLPEATALSIVTNKTCQ